MKWKLVVLRVHLNDFTRARVDHLTDYTEELNTQYVGKNILELS